MEIKLLHHTPLVVAVEAIRTCWDSTNKGDSDYSLGIIGEKDKELVKRVGVKNKHSSTLEHLVYSFKIKGISRALLQELARHRIASLSVKSTRYTLKELKKENSLIEYIQIPKAKGKIYKYDRAKKYVVLPNNTEVRNAIVEELERLRKIVKENISNDVAKYALPEAYKTELVWTINARSLRNFLELRTGKAALQEIRKLAYRIFEELPIEHVYLFTDCIYKKDENKDSGDEHV